MITISFINVISIRIYAGTAKELVLKVRLLLYSPCLHAHILNNPFLRVLPGLFVEVCVCVCVSMCYSRHYIHSQSTVILRLTDRDWDTKLALSQDSSA